MGLKKSFIAKEFILGILIIFLVIIYLNVYSVKTPELFLKKNQSIIQFDSNRKVDDGENKQFELLENSVNNNDIILTSYTLINQKSCEMDYELLKFLIEKENVKYYINDMSYSHTYLINEYLKTGNEELLDYYIQTSNIENKINVKEKWISINEFNKELENDSKIKVFGLGKEDNKTAFYVINYLINKNKIPMQNENLLNEIEEINLNFDDDNVLAEINRLELYEVINKLYDDLNSDENFYEEYMKDDYEYYKILITWLYKENSLEGYSDYNMYEKFIEIYNYNDDGKYFGSFKGKTGYQDKIGSRKPLGLYMNQSDSPVLGKVLTISYLQGNNYSNTMKAVSGDNTVIFNLQGIDSPFEKYLSRFVFPSLLDKVYGGAATDYFQFVIKLE